MADGHRHAVITADDHGPVLSIVAWVMMVTMILIIAVRLAIRISAGSPGIDDILAVIAMFVAIGSTAAISVAVNDGLGRTDLVRSLSHTTRMQKNVYISSLLYLLALWLAKLSTIILIARLCAQKSQQYVLYGVFAFIIAWGLAAVFLDAFRCPIADPYDLYAPQCINIFTFWNTISSLDIITDLILILLPVYLFSSLKMRLSRKLVVFAAFASRILVIVTAVTRLVYLNTTFRHSPPDQLAFNAIPFQICTQVQQSLAIIVAAAPALKNFLDRTASGMLNVSLGGLTGATFGKDSYNMTNLGNSRSGRSRSGNHERLGDNGALESSGFNPTYIRASTAVISSPRKGVKSTHSGHSLNKPEAAPAGSENAHPPLPNQRSTYTSTSDDSVEAAGRGSEDARSDQMIIQVQRDWKVEYH